MSLDTKSYTLYLSSSDKVSTSKNNNAIFEINWASFLPNDYTEYKVSYSFLTTGGYYIDTTTSTFSNCRIVADFNGRNYSYDSSNKAQSITLGFAQRGSMLNNSSNSFSSFLYQFPAKTINTPNQNILNIKIYNTASQGSSVNPLLVNTSSLGNLANDMTSWNMVLEFAPILSSHVDFIQASARQSTRHNN